VIIQKDLGGRSWPRITAIVAVAATRVATVTGTIPTTIARSYTGTITLANAITFARTGRSHG